MMKKLENGSEDGARILNLPCALIIEKSVCSLFVFVCDHLWLLMALKPRLILLVKSPALAFQRLCREILLVGTLSIVEDVEEGVCVDSACLVQ